MTDSLMQEIVDKEATTLNWVVQSGRQLSLESSNSFVGDAGYFRRFLDKTSDYFRGLTFKFASSKKLDEQQARNITNWHTYDKLRSRDVYVAPGFSNTGIEFTDTVIVIIEDLVALPNTIKQVIKVLSILINEPDRRAAQTGIQRLHEQVRLVDEKYLEDIKYCFRNESRIAVKFGDMFDNNREFLTTVEYMNKLNAMLAKINFVEIKQLVNRAADLGAKLSNQLENDEDTNLSGAVAGQLSELFYRLGVTVTAASVVIEVMPQMTDGLEKTLASILKQTA